MTNVTTWMFRLDGALAKREHENPDGSSSASIFSYDDSGRLTFATIRNGNAAAQTWIYERDAAGRLTRITSESGGLPIESYTYGADEVKTKVLHVSLNSQSLGIQFGCAIEESGSIFSAVSPATVTTSYNERGHTAELVFHNASGQLLSRVECVYDANGNLVEELETRSAEALPPDLFAQMNPAQTAMINKVLGAGGEPTRHTHRYDERGRQIETRHSIPPLSVVRKTIAYNQHDNPAAEIEVEEQRDFQMNDEGELSSAPDTEKVSRVEVRFDYEHDLHGNWTFKTTSARSGSDQDFTVSSAERRVIEYFPSP
jgi:YD repeat-containing protein